MYAKAEAPNFKLGQEWARPSLERWCELVCDLPDIRLDKVVQARRALRQCMYDSDDVLEATVRLLDNEVGILCRRGPGTDSS